MTCSRASRRLLIAERAVGERCLHFVNSDAALISDGEGGFELEPGFQESWIGEFERARREG